MTFFDGRKDIEGIPSTLSSTSSSKKLQSSCTSVAAMPGKSVPTHPRPVVHVRPRGIGPIRLLGVNDVLCGRGGRVNGHAGNVNFRRIVADSRDEYLAKTTRKLEKAHIAAKIVRQIRNMNPPGRFLKEDPGTDLWYDIGDSSAIRKTGQALREHAATACMECASDNVLPPSPLASSTQSKAKAPGYATPTTGFVPLVQGVPSRNHRLPRVHAATMMSSFPTMASINVQNPPIFSSRNAAATKKKGETENIE